MNNNIIVNDRDLPGDTFTYLSPAHNTTSWLDHIISSRNCPLHYASVLYDMSVFDHFPISITLSIPIKSSATSSRHLPLVKEMVDWSNFDSNSAIDYNETVLRCLERTSVCCDNTCTYDHNDRIDAFYDILIHSIKEGTINNRFVKTKKFVPVPGWNRHCKGLYAEARDAFLNWLRNGKVRHGRIYEEMKVKKEGNKVLLIPKKVTTKVIFI